MKNKLFALIIEMIIVVICLGNIDIRTPMSQNSQIREQQEEELEEEGVKMVNKSIAICQEISNFSRNSVLTKDYMSGFVTTQNTLTNTLNKVINFVTFPINLTLNLFCFGFNTIAILCEWNESRAEISTTSIFYNNDYTSGSSYGGGGGAFNGGR